MKRVAMTITLILGLFQISNGQLCTGNLGPVIYSEDFGTGPGPSSQSSNPPTGVITTYAFSSGLTGPGHYGLVTNPVLGYSGWYNEPNSDHTQNGNGYMMIFDANATPDIFFEKTINAPLCPGTNYEFSAWIANIYHNTATAAYYPIVAFEIRDALTNALLGSISSGSIPPGNPTMIWRQFALIFTAPASGNPVKLRLVNNCISSGGNDLGIDDITFRPCGPQLTASISVPTNCAGQPVTLTTTQGGSAYTTPLYQWQSSTNGTTWSDIPGAKASTYTTPALTSTSPLFYRAAVAQAPSTPGGNCGVFSNSVQLTINPRPPAPTVISPVTYCQHAIAMPLTATGSNLLWYTTPTGGTGTAIAPTPSTATSDTLTWYVSQTTALGCESDRAPAAVIVVSKPVPDFTFDVGYACSQDTVHFHNTTTYGTSYLWDFDDGFQDTATNPLHIYNSQGTYTIRLQAYNAYCADSVLKLVAITHPLMADFTTSGDTICIGSTVTFTNTSTVTAVNGIDPQYQWTFGDGGSAILQNPAHTYASPGIYEISMVVTNSIPCSDTAYRTLYVDSLPRLSLSGADTSICTGQITMFKGTYTQNGLDQILWNFGENADLIPDANPAQHAFDAPGVYTITLYGNYRICPDVNATVQLVVNPIPHIDLGPDTSICLDGMAFALSDNNNAGNLQASWHWNNGDTTAAVTIKHQGTYKATVTIDQCSASDEVVVHKDCYIDIPNSFTPNGDGVNDYFFPRQFLSEGVANFRMTVYNRWGQTVFETENPIGRGWDGRFNNKDQPLGVYIYAIKVVMKNQRSEAYTGNVTLLR